jgi:hypothetical protein
MITMENCYWEAESWFPDFPPENWKDIVAEANQEIDNYMQEHGLDVYDDEAEVFSQKLWESWIENGNLPEYLKVEA